MLVAAQLRSDKIMYVYAKVVQVRIPGVVRFYQKTDKSGGFSNLAQMQVHRYCKYRVGWYVFCS